MSEIIKLENVSFCYDNICAIEPTNLSIEKNQCIALVGPNGGGKSTILKLLTGLLPPKTGKISIDKDEKISYIAQGINFDKNFPITVERVVLLGLLESKIKPIKRFSKEDKAIVEKTLKQLNILNLKKRRINQLSGGQLKRVLIARAIASKSTILILDEPEDGLDKKSSAELYQELEKLKKDKTILIVSHRIENILKIADKVIYINKTLKELKEPQESMQLLNLGENIK